MPLFECPDCKNKISTNASVCPQCGNDNFSLPTGNKRMIECSRCHGSGKEKPYLSLFNVWVHTSCENYCRNGRIPQKEFLNVKYNTKEWRWD